MPSHPTSPARPAIPREIRVLIAAAFVIAIGYGLVSPVLPQYARSFDVGVAAASVIVSAFAFMRLVFAPAGGALITRLGERPVYLAGLLIVAASTGACALANSYWQLLAYRGLGGIGSTMFTVSAMGLIVRLAPPSIRGRVSASYASAFLIGGIAGPILGGFTAGFGYRVPFIIYAIALVIAAGVVAVFLSGASLRAEPGVAPLEPLSVREAWDDSAYRAALVAGFANGWANFGVRVALVPLVPLFAATGGLGPAWAGIALTMFAAGNAVALTISGRLVDGYGRRRLVILGLVISAVGTGALGWAHEIVPFLVLSVVAGAGAGFVNPAQQAAVADIIGQDRSGGKVLAAFQMATDSGAILGPVLAGRLADVFGFESAFGVTAIVLLVGAAAWLPARETMVRVDADGPSSDPVQPGGSR
ncbi:MAG: MFS transporter [Micrococcales bacterium]|nr:MFS transporter [Micrococcales bacterium]